MKCKETCFRQRDARRLPFLEIREQKSLAFMARRLREVAAVGTECETACRATPRTLESLEPPDNIAEAITEVAGRKA